ncbi:MAG: four helix bundle protein [Brevundimonas sp.]|uniref:four helix bundle protein n=1 Tax=Brevundimonas sp. TaxID=1871086 RepID=UPI004034688E
MEVRSYRDLMVWKKSMDLAAAVYRLTRQMPKHEEYRITSQMVRASTSIPANIAEGHGRGTRKDYAHFVSIARGSLFELETFVLLVQHLKIVDEAKCGNILDQADEVSRMLTALRARLVPRT